MRKKMAAWGNARRKTQDNSITVRRLSLPVTSNLDPVVVKGLPEESFLYVAVSLLCPYLEPYLIRTMQEAKAEISEPRLVADIEAFIGQESQHYRQHILFNRSLNLKKHSGLKALVAEMERDYQLFTKTRSHSFNLAYAEGFEAGTAAGTRFLLEVDALKRLHPSARDFFQWHLMEELEHRTVAFDVFKNVSGSYLTRVSVGLFAQWHLIKFLFRVVHHMMHVDDKEFQSTYGGFWQSFGRLRTLLGPASWRLLPKLVGTHMPWYTPHKIVMNGQAQALAAEYSARVRPRNQSHEVTL